MRRGLMGRDETELPVAAIEARLARLRAAMAAAGFDAFVVYTNNVRPSAVTWLTGFTPYWSDALLLVGRTGAPAFATALSKRVSEWIRTTDPVVFLENELLYGRSFEVPKLDDWVLPIGKARIMREGRDVTIVSYSIGVGLALEAADKLAEEGIDAEVIDLRTLRPLDKAAVLKSLAKTNRMVVVEEGWPTCSIASIAPSSASRTRSVPRACRSRRSPATWASAPRRAPGSSPASAWPTRSRCR